MSDTHADNAANTSDSDTPRTDAENIVDESGIYTSEIVPTDFARQLERELAVARGATVIDGKKRMRCSQDVAFSIQAMKERYETDTDQLRAKVAELEATIAALEADKARLEHRLTWARKYCRVWFYPPDCSHPIEHVPHAGKDMWKAIAVYADQAMQEDTKQ